MNTQTLELDFTQPYYNSIPLQGDELLEATERAETQEDKVKEFFKNNPSCEFTPFTVQEELEIKCINSVRRSITNLEKKGVLRKTGNRVEGRFGVKNNCWQFNVENN